MDERQARYKDSGVRGLCFLKTKSHSGYTRGTDIQLTQL
jgi:hypothetical protein